MSTSLPWSAEAPDWPAPSFDALLTRWQTRDPSRTLLAWRDPADAGSAWQRLDVGSFAAAVERMAAGLHGQGIGQGDRVAWLGFNHPGQLVLLWALARLGAVFVPLNHRLSPAEWAAVLADCSPRLLVHDAAWCEQARALGAWPGSMAHERVCAVDALARVSAEPAPSHPEDATQPLLLVYTSGTTGHPKAAVHTQANLLANMAIAGQVQALSEQDVVLTVLPLFHVGGLCIQTLPALAAGAQVLLMARFDPGATLQSIAQDRPTLTLQVPATLQALVSHPSWSTTDVSSLRAVWAGSSVLPPAPLQAFLDRGVPVCNVYGSTETGPFSVALPPAFAASHLGSCGWPAPGVQVRLLGVDGGEAAQGQVGELCVRGPNVVARYWPDRPAVDTQGFFHSGDLARQAPDGSFTVVGRAKDMIISGGENIYPAEIENLLVQHPAVAECAVIGQPDARWGEVAVACVVLREPQAPQAQPWAERVQAFLDGRLARYKWPRRWVALDRLPRTALGKVQKGELRALLDARPPA